jgi:hypothetical protein
MAKTIKQTDPAVAEFGDWMLFWDESANDGAGGTRRTDFADLAKMMAGQGLNEQEGKIRIGGDIAENDFAAISLWENSYFEFNAPNYDAYWGIYYNQLGDSTVAAQASRNISFEVITDDSISLLARMSLSHNYFDESTAYLEADNIGLYGDRVQIGGKAFYAGSFDSDMENEDLMLASAGWVRSKLGNGVLTKGSNSFADGENLKLDFAGWQSGWYGYGGMEMTIDLPNTGTDAYFEFWGTEDEAFYRVSVGGSETSMQQNGNMSNYVMQNATWDVSTSNGDLQVNNRGTFSDILLSVRNGNYQFANIELYPDQLLLYAGDNSQSLYADIALDSTNGEIGITANEFITLHSIDSTIVIVSGNGQGVNYVNMSQTGSSVNASGTGTAPSSYLGNPAYLLARPDYYIKASLNGVAGLIPFYAI